MSKFGRKFCEKVTSGNTGLNFSMIYFSGINTDICRADSLTKLSAVLPEVAISRNCHHNFDRFIQPEFSINQKMESTIML